jgi:hypothetical protein
MAAHEEYAASVQAPRVLSIREFSPAHRCDSRRPTDDEHKHAHQSSQPGAARGRDVRGTLFYCVCGAGLVDFLNDDNDATTSWQQRSTIAGSHLSELALSAQSNT